MKGRKIRAFLVWFVAVAAVGCGAAKLLEGRAGSWVNALFWISILVFAVGCMACMKGSPRAYGRNFREFTAENAVKTETDRGAPDYGKHHLQNDVFDPQISGLALMAAGAALFALSLLA